MNPSQTARGDNVVPRHRDFGMAAKKIGAQQFFANPFLSGIDDLNSWGTLPNLLAMPLLNRVTKD